LLSSLGQVMSGIKKILHAIYSFPIWVFRLFSTVSPPSVEEQAVLRFFANCYPDRVVTNSDKRKKTNHETIVYVYYWPTKHTVILPEPYALFLIDNRNQNVTELDPEASGNSEWRLWPGK